MIKYSSIVKIKKKVKLINIAIQLFDNISTGSSLNPDEDNDELNFNDELGEYAEYIEDDKENEEDYEKYNFKNTVEQIFKTEKINKNTGENDPRRFEDVDI